MKALQKAIVAQVQAEHAETASSLPSELQSPEELAIDTGMGADKEFLQPAAIRVLPPEDSQWTPETTNGLEARMTFPVIVRVKTLASGDTLEALRDVVGLVIDGISRDHTLGGLCAGPDDPAFKLSAITLQGGDARQEVACSFIVRN